MRIFLILLFFALLLSAGAVFGRLASELIAKRSLHRSKQAWLLCTALLLGLGGVLIHSCLLAPEAVPDEDTDSGAASSRPSYGPATAYQFELDSIKIPGAHRWEKKLSSVSVEAAVNYLELGTRAWNRKYKCIGCHTNGTYLLIRPMLTSLGPPSPDTREFVLDSLRPYLEEGSERVLNMGHRAAQVVYAAAGLASWDAYVERSLSSETDQVLRLLFRLQLEDGTWKVPSCWPPLQSSRFQLATVAALGVGMAPGWAENIDDAVLEARVERLRDVLRTGVPPHDYARVWLLWAGSRLDGILEGRQQEHLIQMIWDHQRKDGGWSVRSFAKPHEWGNGSREEKITSDRDFYMPGSDGHMTGLAVIALREAGVSALDPRIQQAVGWIDSNQRESGRWWTSSLNSEGLHLITYSATSYALLSLWKCNALSRPNP